MKLKERDNLKDPYEKTSIFGKISFSWVNPLINIVRHRSLSMQDHHELSAEFDVSRTIQSFEEDFAKHKSLWQLFITHIKGKSLLVFINIIFTLCEILNVLLLYKLTEYLKDVKEGLEVLSKYKLATFFGLMIVFSVCLNILETIYDFLLYRQFMKIKNNYTLLVAKYILKINMHSNSETSKGNLVNLIQIDCAAVEDVGYELVASTYIVFQLILCFIIGLYLFPTVFGFYFGCYFIFMLLNVGLLNLNMKIEKIFMSIRDDKLSFITGVVTNIRFVKFNVLENYFAKLINNYRSEELKQLWKFYLIDSVLIFIDWISPAISKICFFVAYFSFYAKMSIQSYMAFINLDSMLASTFLGLPYVFSAIFRIRLAFHRINQFFKIQPFYTKIVHEEASRNLNVNFSGEELKEEKVSNQSTPKIINNGDVKNSMGLKEIAKNDQDAGDKSFPLVEDVKNNSIEFNDVNFSYFNPEVEEFEDLMEEDDSSSDEEVEQDDEYDVEEYENKDGNVNETGQPVETEGDEPLFKLSKGHLALRHLNVKIAAGELVFIIGGIGSGKSSFLYSVIGELNQIFSDNIVNRYSKGDEYIKIDGSISFSPQKPFILSKTVRENILFYENEDKERLNRAIKMAFLEEDISNFDGGLDKLLIENGMNLSGGQRSRINLARCFYKDTDIYLLDSPFAALDFDTSRRILEETLLKTLAGKTRIVVTHNIQFLRYADHIILLKRGKVAFSGNFIDFTDTQFYRNYRSSIRFNSKLGNIIKKNDLNLRKRSKSKGYIDIVERKASMTKFSHSTIAITKEERQYFKGFLNEDKVEGRQLVKMFGLLFRYYGGFLFLLVAFIISIVCNYMQYFSSLYLYDLIEKNKTHGKQFWEDIKIYIAFNILPALISFVRVIIISAISIKTSQKLHQQMIFEVLHADLCLFHDKIEPARIINRFSSDYDSVDFYVASSLDHCLLLFSFLTFEIFITKEATSIYIISIFILYYITIFYYQGLYIKARKDLFRLERIGNTPIINLTNQIVEGSVVIKVFQKQKEIVEELSEYINANSKNTVTIASLDGWFNIRLAFINIFFVQFFAFLYILVFTSEKTINAKQLEIFISLIYVMILDTKEFMQKFCWVETETINLERCDALLHLPPEKQYLNLQKERQRISRIDRVKQNSLLPLKIYDFNEKVRYSYKEINQHDFNKTFFLKGHIVFQSVSAKYPLTPDYVLRNITFELHPGEKLGIMGKTGSGKSTILKLLLQYFKPDKGKIIVDEYDISQIDAKKLRSEFLVISQEITLFEGTLRDNLIFENVIHKAPKTKTQIHDRDVKPRDSIPNFLNEPLLRDKSNNQEVNIETPKEDLEQEIISKLIEFGFSKSKLNKFGLDLPITNNGENLSTGEQQLISFFKAFFTQKKIIILDEATASFDYVTQQKLIDYFNQKIKGKTVISVAHKITAIADFDKLLVLDKGFVVEYGYIKDLVKDDTSHFKTLIEQYLKF